MKRLTLVRHAHAAGAGPTGDHSRPLDERGLRDAAAAGEGLLQGGVQPALIVASDAARAAATARILARALSVDESAMQHDPAIYDASAGTLLGIVQNLDDSVQEAMLVGHNPGMSEFLLLLLGRSVAGLAPGDSVPLTLECEDWASAAPGCARLR